MSILKKQSYDAAIIGGGFYGCVLALHLKRIFKKVILVEKEVDLLLKASYNNQARIHNGYHYPRSLITALRSHINYNKFILDFKNCVVDNFQMVYAVASNNSKVTTAQFLRFCHQINSPIVPAPAKIKDLFNDRLIEDAFLVDEAVFDAKKLREILRERLRSIKVKIRYQTEVIKISPNNQGITIHLADGEKILSGRVLNCSYSNINSILKDSHIRTLPLKQELTEMPLLAMPASLKRIGITIMDGPFFSIMPFPNKKLHTLHHVRYTPLASTLTNNGITDFSKSNAIYMLKDAQRFIPLLQGVKYKESLYEIKTVLQLNETNDARPILFRKDYGMKNFFVIMGGKIDNIYDIVSEMEKVFKG